MATKLSDGQVKAFEEAMRRGILTGDRAAAARELIRRSREPADGKSERARKIAEMSSSGAGAFMHSFANAATLGLADRGVELMNAGARALGLDSLTSDETRQVNEQVAVDHPYADLAGSVAGTVAGGRGVGGLAARVGIRPAKRFLGRVAQYAAGGATAGGAEQAIREGGLSGDTAASAVVGGLAGAVGGGAAEKVLPLARNVGEWAAAKLPGTRPRLSPAWRKLAARLQTPVDDIAAYIADTRAATGVAPSIAQVTHARDQGLLQGWAARHNTFGTKFREAADAAPAEDLSAGKLETSRDDRATALMGSRHASGRAVRDVEIDLPPDLLSDPSFNRGVPRAMRQKVQEAADGRGKLTVNDADIIRRRLRRMESSPANLGEDFADVADELEMHTGDQVPEYASMVRQYRDDSDFLRGFEEGMAGRDTTEATGAAGRSVRRTTEGAAGHKAGTLTRRGQRTLNTIAPATPAYNETLDAGALARGAAHVAAGSRPFGVFVALRSLMDMLPESYQQELATGLLTRDPAAIQATLGKLRQAGADLQDIRRLAGGMATLLGADASAVAGAERGR